MSIVLDCAIFIITTDSQVSVDKQKIHSYLDEPKFHFKGVIYNKLLTAVLDM